MYRDEISRKDLKFKLKAQQLNVGELKQPIPQVIIFDYLKLDENAEGFTSKYNAEELDVLGINFESIKSWSEGTNPLPIIQLGNIPVHGYPDQRFNTSMPLVKARFMDSGGSYTNPYSGKFTFTTGPYDIGFWTDGEPTNYIVSLRYPWYRDKSIFDFDIDFEQYTL